MTARPSSVTPLTCPRSTFHARSASRPGVAASPFMMQAPANTSAVLASTYVPVTAGPVAATDAAIRLDSAADSAIFFITFTFFSRVALHRTAAAVPAARVRTDRLAVGAEGGLRLHTPPRGLVILIVERCFVRIHHSI